MNRGILICFGFAVLLVSGCQQQLKVTVNPDGSGTVAGHITFSDRVAALMDESANLMEEITSPIAGAMFGAELQSLTEQLPFTEEGMRAELSEAMTVTSLKRTEQEDGGVRFDFEGTFADSSFFGTEFAKEILGVALYQGEAGQALVVVNLLNESAAGGEEEQAQMLPFGEAEGLGASFLYLVLKGFYKSVTVVLPDAVTSDSGTIGDGGKSVSWTLDLRDRAGLKASKELMARMKGAEATAVLSAKALKFDLPDRPAAADDTPMTGAPKAKTDPVKAAEGPAEVAARVERVLATRSVSPEQPGETSIDSFAIEISVAAPPDKAILSVDDVQLTALQDDTGQNLAEYFSTSTYETEGGTTVSISPQAPAPGAKKVTGLKGVIPVVRVSKLQELRMPIKDFLALEGREKTGNALLDEVKFSIQSVGSSSVSVLTGEESGPDVLPRVRSMKLVRTNGDVETPWSSHCSWGTCDFSFDDPLEEAKEVIMEIITGIVREEVGFALAEIAIP